METSHPAEATEFWQAQQAQETIAAMVETSVLAPDLPNHVTALGQMVTQGGFWREQETFDDTARAWEQYVSMFQETYQREPVVWDLCCGEGGYSRGAREAGCLCYGFDHNGNLRARYENDPPDATGATCPSGMHFVLADVLSDQFWEELGKKDGGMYSHIPRPDIISVSPPVHRLHPAP